VVACHPATACTCCGGTVEPYAHPSFRHQVFELPQQPLQITEYQLFHGRCRGCGEVAKGALPADAPRGQMGPALQAHIGVLAGQYHLSVRKIQQLLQAQFGVTFSVGAISEVQGRVAFALTPLHQALKRYILKADCIHADETHHSRNDDPDHTRWHWLLSSVGAVFQQILGFRNQEMAKQLLADARQAVVVTDQCASYHWLDATRHQFCWAHVQRNLQKMADYAGGGLTARIGQRLVLLCRAVFRCQHRYQDGVWDELCWRHRMSRLRRRLDYWLKRGSTVPSSRYAGRCQYLLKYEQGLWVFLNHAGIPLTNNAAERDLRGAVIMRKICYGTSSDRGDKFRSRLLSLVETCKKRGKSPFKVLTEIMTAVQQQRPYPDVLGLNSPLSI
jgi:transposase